MNPTNITSLSENNLFKLDVPVQHNASRLDSVLAALIPSHSRSAIQKAIRQGKVTVNKVVVKEPKFPVYGDEQVVAHIEALTPEEHWLLPQDIPFAVIYEDESIIVVDKPAGLTVHPGAGNASGTLVNGLLYRFEDLFAVPRAGIIHRLDKGTSGLMLVARTSHAHQELTLAMQERGVRREYIALVEGELMEERVIETYLHRSKSDRLKQAVSQFEGKFARTFIYPQALYDGYTLVVAQLDTGRTHQIRVHMQHIGYPIVGDRVYGKKGGGALARRVNMERQALHAQKITLKHPMTGKDVSFISKVSEDFSRCLKALED